MDLEQLSGMTDEEFLQLQTAPADEAPVVEAAQAAAPAVTEQNPLTNQEPAPVVEQQLEEQHQELSQEELDAQAAAAEPQLDEHGQPVVAATEEQTPVEEAPNYQVLYESLTAPIKANGKDLVLTPEEMRQLAQKGANYTQKMQALAPHRKTLLMLENNGLDAERLNFLIDLNRKDPAAIQKFLKESGINPLDIDTDAEPTYQSGNHTVTDEEANFQEALESAQTTESGKAILTSINSQWDQASKELLFKQPGIIDTMISQLDNGVYTRIVGEMDRQRMIGNLPVGQSWLESYKHVGDQMVAAGKFNDLVAQQEQSRQTTPPVAAPVATRVIAPKPQVAPNPKAAAAAPSRAAAAPAKAVKNPLEMDDDEFLKQFQNRL